MNSWRKEVMNLAPQRYIKFVHSVGRKFNFYMKSYCLRPPLPKDIIIDPINICNLHCPLCPTGTGKSKLELKMMSFDTFKLVLEKIPSAKYITLNNWGEAFLNPDIFKIIRFASDKNIAVGLHSNFNHKKDDDFFLNIVNSGLDKLVIPIDGINQASYSEYRVGGNLNLVFDNLRRLLKARKDKPKIIWRLLAIKYNEDEIEDCKNMAEKLGVEFEVAPISLADYFTDNKITDESIEERKDKWLGRKKRYIFPRYKKKFGYPLYNETCTQLFEMVIVNPDGTIFPCCFLTDKKNVFGDLKKESFKDIWYNEKYISSRSLFLKSKENIECYTICQKCNLFKKRGK